MEFSHTNIPETIKTAFNRSDKMLANTSGDIGHINTSSIADVLIYECGRWTEHHSSDFLLDWDHIRNITEGRTPIPETGLHNLFVFGIRTNGVDHMNFVMHRLTENIGPFSHYLKTSQYNRILALDVTVDPQNRATLVLKDIKHNLTTLNRADQT